MVNTFYDTNLVNVLSNFFKPTSTVKPLTPPIVQAYKDQFNICDKFNRLVYDFYWNHRSSDWQHSYFDGVLQMSICNAWVLYNAAYDEQEMPMEEFIKDIANDLLV